MAPGEVGVPGVGPVTPVGALPVLCIRYRQAFSALAEGTHSDGKAISVLKTSSASN